MNFEKLSYYLFMESEEIKNKSYKDLTEYEKINLKINPFLDREIATKGENLQQVENYPKNIPLYYPNK